VYLGTLVAAALVCDFSQARDYLTVGASGILGALLFLGLFAKVQLPPIFFVVNVGLNVALAAGNSRINWAAHLGGFAAGLIGCALLDLVERANGYLLRCKFPESIKLNGFIVTCAATAWLFGIKSPVPLSSGLGAQPLATFAVVCLIGIKLVDLILSMRKGLAVIVVLFAGANAGLALLWLTAYTSAWAQACTIAAGRLQDLLRLACGNAMTTWAACAAAIFVATILAYRASLARGLSDVGFVGASLRAERARRSSL
jgi:rhomboid protease GluP